MNVTKENFNEAAAEIEALLPTAVFVAFDEEMTGISIPGNHERVEDTPSQRYRKMREVAATFNIIQFGLALFHAGEGDNHYKVRAYNFYLFPEAGRVNMDGAAVAFNRNHGMDWNKWIREGIPYTNRQGAERLRQALFPNDNGSKKRKDDEKKMELTKPSDVEAVETALAGLKAWLADENRSSEAEYEIITTNAYLRKYLHQVLASEFPLLTLESKPTSPRGMATLVALRLDEAQRIERDAKLRAEKESELARKVGFRRVFQALVDAKKPMVGQAFMFDILFAIAAFECPLPETYQSFKELVHDLFPLLFDTQHLAKQEPFKFAPLKDNEDPEAERTPRFGSMALGELHKVLHKETSVAKGDGKPVVEFSFALNHDRYDDPKCSAFHEAGFDAYITGCVFAHFSSVALSPERRIDLAGRSTMFRGLFEFNMAGGDELVFKGVYVHTRGLKGRDADDLKQAFVEIKVPAGDGGETEAAPISIKWIDDDSAFVVLPETCRDAVARMLERANDTDKEVAAFRFSSWEDWLAAQAEIDAVSTTPKQPELKRPRAENDDGPEAKRLRV